MSAAEDWARLMKAADAELKDATDRLQAAGQTVPYLRLTLGPQEANYATRLTRINGVPYLEHGGILSAANALELARWIQEWFADIPEGR